jgi:hypothetical protein
MGHQKIRIYFQAQSRRRRRRALSDEDHRVCSAFRQEYIRKRRLEVAEVPNKLSVISLFSSVWLPGPISVIRETIVQEFVDVQVLDKILGRYEMLDYGDSGGKK